MKRLGLLSPIAWALCSALAPPLSAADGNGGRPNVLFIIVDDQSPFDLKVYNPDSPLETPHIDRLAREGLVFDGAYHMGAFVGAVCTPSRHMIMSGRTVWHLPIAPGAMAKGLCPPGLEQNTIPAVFNRAGYDTMRTCKMGNSYEAANKLFQVRHDATKRGGTPETGSAWHGDRVLEYLRQRQAAKDTDPFLVYFGFSHPHDERDGTPELLAKYGAVNHTDRDRPPPANPQAPKLPANYLPAHPFPHGHPGLRDEVAVSGVWERRDERTIRNELGREFACSENIDIQIGRVLEQLEAMGELDNTYIFYTADHGIAIGRHGLQGKQNLYQHTWRVPFIVKGPGIKPGSRGGRQYLPARRAGHALRPRRHLRPRDQRGRQLQAGPRRQAAHRPRRPLRRLQRRHQAGDAERQEGGLEADRVRRPGRQGAPDPALQPGGEPPRVPRAAPRSRRDRTDRPDARGPPDQPRRRPAARGPARGDAGPAARRDAPPG